MLRIYRQDIGDRLYLDTRAYRGYAAEHPVGDPFGGAAYGEKAMPVVAVVAAAASFATGATIAFAAGATMGAMVAGGAMMVGAAMTIVGVVTDRPNLVKWGGILSAVGGIGAGILGANGMLTEGAAAGAGGFVDTIGDAATGASAGESLTGAVAPGVADQAIAPPAEGTVTTPLAPTEAVTPQTSLLEADAAQTGAVAQPVAPVEPPATAFSTGAPDAYAPGGPNAYSTEGLLGGVPEDAVGAPMTAQTTNTGMLDRVSRWVRENKELAQMATQGVSGLLGAVPKPETPYQRALTNRTNLEAARLDPNSSWWRKYPLRG